jgi:hypothetical protein avisC_04866
MSHPNPDNKPSLYTRLRKTKAALLATVLTLAGILLVMLNGWLSGLNLGDWAWLHALPLGELGGTLFGAGLLGTLFEYSFRKDQEATTTRQFRQIIHDEAPAMRDAVIEGFRFNTDDLERIATPQLLDELAVNSLGMRFGDAAFGREVYGDIKHQAITAEERWYDARVDATLGIPRVRSVAPNPFFDLLVRWEYTVVPKHRFRKFAVVSDRQRYDQMVAERGETSVWFKPSGTGLDVTDEASFALVEFSVNGSSVSIERTADTHSQIYTVDIGEDLVTAQQPVVMSFTYRSRLRRDGHMVHFDVDRPTKGFELELNYQDAGIAKMKLVDFISSTRRARVSEAPDVAGVKKYTMSYDGWVLPRAGVAFVWILEDESLDKSVQAHETQEGAAQTAGKKRGRENGSARSAKTA